MRMRQSSASVLSGPVHGNLARWSAAGRYGVPKLARNPSTATASTVPATATRPADTPATPAPCTSSAFPAVPTPSRMAPVVAARSFALAEVT